MLLHKLNILFWEIYTVYLEWTHSFQTLFIFP